MIDISHLLALKQYSDDDGSDEKTMCIQQVPIHASPYTNIIKYSEE